MKEIIYSQFKQFTVMKNIFKKATFTFDNVEIVFVKFEFLDEYFYFSPSERAKITNSKNLKYVVLKNGYFAGYTNRNPNQSNAKNFID